MLTEKKTSKNERAGYSLFLDRGLWRKGLRFTLTPGKHAQLDLWKDAERRALWPAGGGGRADTQPNWKKGKESSVFLRGKTAVAGFSDQEEARKRQETINTGKGTPAVRQKGEGQGETRAKKKKSLSEEDERAIHGGQSNRRERNNEDREHLCLRGRKQKENIRAKNPAVVLVHLLVEPKGSRSYTTHARAQEEKKMWQITRRPGREN